MSGSIAVILGAYGNKISMVKLSLKLTENSGISGAHRKWENKDSNRDLKQIFETANRYHFYHTFALLALPLARRPMLVSFQIFYREVEFQSSQHENDHI